MYADNGNSTYMIGPMVMDEFWAKKNEFRKRIRRKLGENGTTREKSGTN